MCAAPDDLPTTHKWPGKGDDECFHFKSSECVLWINELSFNIWRILSTNGYNLSPSPVVFVNLSFISLYDEHLWRSDERFCLWRLLCSLTKGYAEWPIGVQSLLLICQPVMNTADGLKWMTIAECAVQLIIDNWPSRNAKRCSIVYFFSPSTREHVHSHLWEGFCSSCKAAGTARETTPRPVTTFREPIPRTGRHRELNPGPLDFFYLFWPLWPQIWPDQNMLLVFL